MTSCLAEIKVQTVLPEPNGAASSWSELSPRNEVLDRGQTGTIVLPVQRPVINVILMKHSVVFCLARRMSLQAQ